MTLDDTKAEALAVIKAQLAQHAANTCAHHVLVAKCGECGKRKPEIEETA